MTDRKAHPLHLVLTALVQRQLEQRGIVAAAEHTRIGRNGSSVLELDAVAERGQGFLVRTPSTSTSYTFSTP